MFQDLQIIMVNWICLRKLSKYDCVKSELCLTLYTASFRALQDEGVQTADSSYSDQETQCTVSKSAEVTEHNLLSWVK